VIAPSPDSEVLAITAFTAYDPICRGDACRNSGYPQVFVNAANLTLFIPGHRSCVWRPGARILV